MEKLVKQKKMVKKLEKWLNGKIKWKNWLNGKIRLNGKIS